MATLEPVGPEFYDEARWKIDTIREVMATPEQVWAAMSDNTTWKTWFPGVIECRTTSDQIGGIGSTRSIKLRGMEATERFIVWEPNAAWGFTILTIKPSFAQRMAERATITDLGGGRTRIVYRMAVDPKPWARWMRPLIAKGAQRSIGTGLENLEQFSKA